MLRAKASSSSSSSQRQDGRLLDQHVLAGRERQPGRFEMAIVGRGDADGIDARRDELLDGIRFRHSSERVARRIRELLLVSLRPAAGAAGNRGQLDFDQAEVAAMKQTVAMEPLEHRPIGLVEDHAQADHAGPECFGLLIKQIIPTAANRSRHRKTPANTLVNNLT